MSSALDILPTLSECQKSVKRTLRHRLSAGNEGAPPLRVRPATGTLRAPLPGRASTMCQLEQVSSASGCASERAISSHLQYKKCLERFQTHENITVHIYS